ncbi:MAG: DUF1801 domain-containing protein [Planctomycetota bacterium]
MTNPETRLEQLLAPFDPVIAKRGRALRAALRRRLPGLHELVYVYARKGSLVISYAPTENGYEGLFALSLEADDVKLYFNRGAELASSDPARLLKGRGKLVRFVTIEDASDLEREEIETLIDASLALADLRLDPRAEGRVVIKSDGEG